MSQGGRTGPRPDDGLKSLVKVVRVLDAFSARNRTLSLTDLCAATGYPKSTVHRLLGAMRETGLLDQDLGRDRYRLGMKLFALGNTVLANMDLHREARPFVDALTRQGGQAVHLAVFDGRRAIVIHRADASPEKLLAAHTIEQAPAHCTGVGKAILAFQPEAVVRRIIDAGLTRYTETTITDPAALLSALATVRAAGYATDEGEHQPGLRCIGAPIRDRSGQVIAGISLTGPAWRLPLAEVDGLSKVVIHHANGISTALGHR
ncbi:IclR family transcriptional regulator [Rhodopila sp.]|uniref:IclR family transcriptional regulator n=1 Tax=Rhodopila sp. TaxID=2480087 RepID=UPI003D0AAB0C